uniref:Invertebrate defensins family profile domain-containing protein n=1 Tax=Heliothis virescens TaxID=7102 RepID=A0A2A4JTY5_HELVI
MKFLTVFVLALVFVAQGKVVPDDGDAVRVIDVQPEAVDVEAVPEVGDVIPQVLEVAGDPALRVFRPAVEERDLPQEMRAFEQFKLPDTLYVPIMSRACTNSACLYICNLLGFQKGVCISTSTCQCTN